VLYCTSAHRRIVRLDERMARNVAQDGLWKVRVADVGREEFQGTHGALLAVHGDDRRRLKRRDETDCRDWLKAS
jgi:hypothetical protein